MKLTVLAVSFIILGCKQKGRIVKSVESFDTASFDPIIEHSKIPAHTRVDTSTYDTLNTIQKVRDSLDSKE